MCSLSGRGRHFKPTREIIGGDLMLLHSRVKGNNSCVRFPTANIMGVPFTAGEWGNYPRCGSVITCLMGHNEPAGPRSLFARVNHFFKVIDDYNPGYASVSWFGEPVYLYRDIPLGTRCVENGDELGRQYGSVVRITQIDPTQIMVEHDKSSNTYVMIRDSGYSTRRRT